MHVRSAFTWPQREDSSRVNKISWRSYADFGFITKVVSSQAGQELDHIYDKAALAVLSHLWQTAVKTSLTTGFPAVSPRRSSR